jgi:hypothetical protein
LRPHVGSTWIRCGKARRVLAVHDTTEIRVPGESERSGMGRITTQKRDGFLAHVALAVDAETGQALGLLALETWTRSGPPLWHGKKKLRSNGSSETERWKRGVDVVEEEAAENGAELIHVIDREGDQYGLLLDCVVEGRRFVVRLNHNRPVVDDEAEDIRALVAAAPVVATRSVEISRRGKGDGKKPRQQIRHPPREARVADLEIRTARAVICRPYRTSRSAARTLEVNVVWASEVGAPEGEEPVDWLLLTSEPVDDEAAALRVLDDYKARWVIEEYFKALKTGCALEKRQLESYFAFVRALALFAPMAWALLALRDAATRMPEAKATAVLSARQIGVLRAYKPNSLPPNPTATDALFAVARLGGFLKRNGHPGWQTLGKGLEKLITLEAGWVARDRISDR